MIDSLITQCCQIFASDCFFIVLVLVSLHIQVSNDKLHTQNTANTLFISHTNKSTNLVVCSLALSKGSRVMADYFGFLLQCYQQNFVFGFIIDYKLILLNFYLYYNDVSKLFYIWFLQSIICSKAVKNYFTSEL